MHHWKGCLHCWMPAHKSQRRAKPKRVAPSITEISRNGDSTPSLAQPRESDSPPGRRQQSRPVSPLVSDLFDFQRSVPTSTTVIHCRARQSSLPGSDGGGGGGGHVLSLRLVDPAVHPRRRQQQAEARYVEDPTDCYIALSDCYSGPRQPAPPPPKLHAASCQIPVDPRLPVARNKKSSVSSSLPSSPPVSRMAESCVGNSVTPPLPLNPPPPDLSHALPPSKKGSLKKLRANLLDLVIPPQGGVGSKNADRGVEQRGAQTAEERSAATNEKAWKLLEQQRSRQQEQQRMDQRKEQLRLLDYHENRTPGQIVSGLQHGTGYADSRLESSRVCGPSCERLRPCASQNGAVGCDCGSPVNARDALASQYIPMNSCSTPSSNPSRCSFSPVSGSMQSVTTSPFQKNSRSLHRSDVDRHQGLPQRGEFRLVDPAQCGSAGTRHTMAASSQSSHDDSRFSDDAMNGNSQWFENSQRYRSFQQYGNSQGCGNTREQIPNVHEDPGCSDYEVMLSPQVRAMLQLSLFEEATTTSVKRPISDLDTYIFQENLLPAKADDQQQGFVAAQDAALNDIEPPPVVPARSQSRKSSLEQRERVVNETLRGEGQVLIGMAQRGDAVLSPHTAKLLHSTPPVACLNSSNNRKPNGYVNDQIFRVDTSQYQNQWLESPPVNDGPSYGAIVTVEKNQDGGFAARPNQSGIVAEKANGWAMSSGCGPVKEDYYNMPSPKTIAVEKSGDAEASATQASCCASKPQVYVYPSVFASPCWSQRSNSPGDVALPQRRRGPGRRELRRDSPSSTSDDDSCCSASGGCNSSYSNEPSPVSRSPMYTNRLRAAPIGQDTPHPVYSLATPPKRYALALSSVPPPPHPRHQDNNKVKYLDIDHERSSSSQSEAEKSGSGRPMPPREAHIDYTEIDCGKTVALSAIKRQIETERSNNRNLMITS